MEAARTRILLSWIVAGIGGLLGLAASTADQQPHTSSLSASFVAVPIMAYALWSMYWGLPPVWTAWRNFLGNTGCFFIANPAGWLILLSLFFFIPLIGAMFYGPYGGGIYEYLKWRRVARGLPEDFASSRTSEPTLDDLLAEAEARRSSLEDHEEEQQADGDDEERTARR